MIKVPYIVSYITHHGLREFGYPLLCTWPKKSVATDHETSKPRGSKFQAFQGPRLRVQESQTGKSQNHERVTPNLT